MTITIETGIYFFSDSKALARDGVSCVASSNTNAQNYILNPDKAFSWQSSGSDDDTTETLTITFAQTSNIDSLFLVNHNFKDFKITYNGGSDFSSVKTVNFYGYGVLTDENGDVLADENGNLFSDGLTSPFQVEAHEINVVDYDQNTSYFEFDAVDVDTIEIEAYNTQTADEEKSLNIFYATSQIGNFSNSGLSQNSPGIDYNNRVYTNINNKQFITKGKQSFSASVRLPYVFTQADIDLVESLLEREENFIMWLCGGKYGSEYFRFNAKPYRLEDVYRVQNTRNSAPNFYQNSYFTGYINGLNVVEVV